MVLVGLLVRCLRFGIVGVCFVWVCSLVWYVDEQSRGFCRERKKKPISEFLKWDESGLH